MAVVGIVAEYNPFHLGHLHQIQETKRLFGEDSVIICTMSGDFVQRGEAAVYTKFARAEAALRAEIDVFCKYDEVKYFMDTFTDSFRRTLDELE